MANSFESIKTNDDVLRIVMVGKTGTGKSASGNTILGQQCFQSKFSAKSMTVDCSKVRGEVDGQQVAVIDTPGLFDTRFDKDQITKHVTQCIPLAAPGPHIFLVVIRLGRFTEEEKQTVNRIQEIFGQAADGYSMVLFTGGDLLEGPIEDFLTECSDLQELLRKCNSKYHVFNNKKNDHSQVTELLQKIRNIVQWNGGSHYTNEMFKEAERAIEEEKQRILKEEEAKIRRQQEELDRKLKEQYMNDMKRLMEQFQAERERERQLREMERRREKEAMDDERRREREALNNERRMEKEAMDNERRREKEAMDNERRRERQNFEEEKKRKQERQDRLNQLNEQHVRQLQEQQRQLREQHERMARSRAESTSSCQIL